MMIQLSLEEQAMLEGREGRAVQKSMRILLALAKIYGAERLIPVTSVQVAGVSYDNLGEAGLEFLSEMASGGGRARVLTTLNPAGMDVENWQALGISPDFAGNQIRVLDAFAQMNILTTCTCTPYLAGNLPHFGEHIAWAESSAVCFANAVLGARTNREGGPSALAAALTGRTPAYGLHLDAGRAADYGVQVDCPVRGTHEFGALGHAIGKQLESARRKTPYICGIESATIEELKSFCASIATYGGAALFHMPGITPEANYYAVPSEMHPLGRAALETAAGALSDSPEDGTVDFVSLGCPHLSIHEIAHLAELLRGKQVKKEFWITTSRPVREMAARMGYVATIEASGARFATDTCCVVAPIRGRFHTLATDSAKACYYAAGKNQFHTLYLSFEEVVQEALK